jgi:16S rRNA (guanine527-N7)-methyltransferase
MADLARFRELLAEWSGKMNLVGPSALGEFWLRHAYDSAQLLQLAPEAKIWADLGAGAGFPGVVLAILLKGTGGRVHLVDSQAKRIRFLTAMVDELKLPAEVHHQRAESFKRKGIDIVTARAVAALPKLLGFAEPLLKSGATGLFLKGRDIEAELTEAQKHWTFRFEMTPSLSDPDGRVLKLWSLARA